MTKKQRAFSERFRQVSNAYPRKVAEAYGLNHDRAMAESDEQAAEKVAEWEVGHGIEPRDWIAIGIGEGRMRLDIVR